VISGYKINELQIWSNIRERQKMLEILQEWECVDNFEHCIRRKSGETICEILAVWLMTMTSITVSECFRKKKRG
jgi:hypothetical protein